MQKLLQGLQHYQTKIFGTQREMFERLSQGQSPDVLFITCSDSRINSNLLTQTELWGIIHTPQRWQYRPAL